MGVTLLKAFQDFLDYFRIRISKFAIGFTILISVIVGFHFERWNHDGIIVHDVILYYAYLPAIIIHNDINLDYRKEQPENIAKKQPWAKKSPIDKEVLKMTMGNAICWLPFFSTAHLYATLDSNYENHGYSRPYVFMIFFAAICYLSIGLIYLRKTLIMYFSDRAVALSIIILVLATNLLHYVTVEPGMSHIYSFSLITVFIYYAINWLKQPGYLRSILMGLLLGLITLIRPTNAIIVIFPLLLFVFEKKPVHLKIHFLRQSFKYLIIIAIASCIFLIPQLIYWKLQSGQYFYYSYGDQKFYFNNPHIIDGLLSYRKGWLVYTPVMMFSIIGLFFLSGYVKRYTFPVVIFSLINVYIIFSWWCWWYGGSYGSRPMIDTYAVFAIPLAAFIQHFLRRAFWLRVVAALVFVFFIYLNLFQMYQYSASLLHYRSMTKEAYWEIFLRKKFPENYQSLISEPDIESALAGEEEY